MMTRRGHTVYHYGHADSEVECTEHVSVTFNEDLEKAYGNYDWKTTFFKYDLNDHANQIFRQRAIVEIGKRKQKHDFILCFWGASHTAIFQAHPDLIPIEPGIGCPTKPVCNQNVFESYSVMNQIYGKYEKQPNWFDCVIPNYFDSEDFEFNPTPKDYFLFVGRIISTKGIGIAVDVTRKLGSKLIVAGQGNLEGIIGPIPDHVEFVGYIEPQQRRELMKNAKALFAPTHYNEPFGGVTIEAMFCGTPVITSDWGGFAENNLHGITGYRCRTLEQFEWAAQNIDRISRYACYEWAHKNFTFDRIAPMYEEFFHMLQTVYSGKGFYEENPNRTNLDWLNRYYPISQESSSLLELEVEYQSCDIPQFHSKFVLDSEDIDQSTPSVSSRESTSSC